MQKNGSVSMHALWAIALPIALQNLVTVSLNFIDGVMIGSLGDTAISGVYMAGQVQMLLQVILGSIEGVVLMLCAQHWGHGVTERVRSLSMLGAVCSLGLGAAVTLLCVLAPSAVLSFFSGEAAVVETGVAYLRVLCLSFPLFCLSHALIASMRAVGSARIGLYASAAALVVNLGLNAVLIHGGLGLPALGIQGAAIATLVSRAVECGIMLLYVLVWDKKLVLRPKDVRCMTRADVHDGVRYGAPVFAGQLIWGVNLLVGTAILGHFDTAVTAAVGIANTANHSCYVCIRGVASAVSMLTGRTIGAGDEARVHSFSASVLRLSVVLGVVTALSLFLLRRPLIALYGVSGQTAELSLRLLAVLAVTVAFTSYQSISCFGLLRGAGAVDFLCLLDAVMVLVIVLPGAAVAYRLGASAVTVFACLKADQVLKCPIIAYKLRRGAWVSDLTRARPRMRRAPSV